MGVPTSKYVVTYSLGFFVYVRRAPKYYMENMIHNGGGWSEAGAAITQNEEKQEEEDDNIVPIDVATRRKSSQGM
jgi:hypothetical protein